MISRVRKLTVTAVTCITLVAGSAAQSDACCLFGWFGQSCCYQPSCCSPCSSCSTCGYGPSYGVGCGCDSCGCSPCAGGGCSSCGVSGCSSCGTGGCSSCGSGGCSSGGCASGNCGVTSIDGLWTPSVAESLFMAPVVTVKRAPRPSADPKFAKPAVDRRVAAPTRDLKVVPVRQKRGQNQTIDLQHSANAKLRTRSSLNESRIARPAGDVEVSRRARTSVIVPVSAETVIR